MKGETMEKKRSVRILQPLVICVVYSLVFLLCATGCNRSNVGYYADNKIGFKFVPPEGWELKTRDEYGFRSVSFYFPSISNTDGVLHISQWVPLSVPLRTPEEFFLKKIKLYKKNKQLVHSRKTSFAKLNAFEFILMNSKYKNKTKNIVIFKKLIISFTASEQEFDNLITIVDHSCPN